MPSSSHFRESAEKPVAREYGETRCAVLKHNEVESRSTFRQRRFFLGTSGYNEPLFKFSDPEYLVKVFLEEQEDFLPQRQNLKCESNNAEQIFSTVLFVIFRDNLIPIVWTSIVPIKAMKNLEKSKAYFMKN